MLRLLSGALAGVAATVAMTAAMRHLAERLPSEERYPLPPREIIGRVAGEDPGVSTREAVEGDERMAAASLAAHALYGAATGALFALQPRRGLGEGAGYGIGVWTASYLGWLPATGILKPATQHPVERNLVMLASHVVWGATLAASLRELEGASATIFNRGPQRLADGDKR
jgi:uncharacterized membrane protein YagU involved in acid resistance